MTAQTHGSRTMFVAFLLFALGLLAVVAIFVLSAFHRHAPWLWAATMALPLGLVVGIFHVVRRR
ncbi:hypothetical protein [Actinokineospora enzanensis]|uniref:hypothetical protein n=1 Tax=Actinokineospora enzanensis TaxID=155975 RepID=UPI0003624F2B|nr:hypothetical protein [Actinokineospora enzanensis]